MCHLWPNWKHHLHTQIDLVIMNDFAVCFGTRQPKKDLHFFIFRPIKVSAFYLENDLSLDLDTNSKTDLIIKCWLCFEQGYILAHPVIWKPSYFNPTFVKNETTSGHSAVCIHFTFSWRSVDFQIDLEWLYHEGYDALNMNMEFQSDQNHSQYFYYATCCCVVLLLF